MRLKVLGSSSAGNCYLLEGKDETLMVECGVNFSEVLKAAKFNIKQIKGCCISHEHGDHAKEAEKVLKYNIPIYCSAGTKNALHLKGVNVMKVGSHYPIGRFFVKPFQVQHDAAEPFGFLIHHPECGLVLFATDTYYLRYKFVGLNNILIECNYSMDILDENTKAGRLPPKLRDRTLKSHMELKQCKAMLQANDLSKVNNIVLIHMSDGNGDAERFKREVEQVTGKPVTIATAGLDIEFNATPF